jgi:uncharacterized protein YjbI with pentapeptide repeats
MANIIRPFQLSCNNRVLEHNRRFYFTVSCTLGFDLLTGKTFMEYDYLFDCIASMGKVPIPDVGFPKPNGEYLVSGKFFAPFGKKTSIGNVKVQLENQEKELYVFGPRHWTTLGISKPELISDFPIDYEHAFGGEGFEPNPKGRGFKSEVLPGIENPKQLITSKGNTPEPVGFSPLDVMVPARAQFRGNYDNYLQKYFPGYPESTDWRFFLTGPKDQWISDFFRGDESFRIENMHPDLPVIEGQLPNLQARCFLKHTIDRTAGKDTNLSLTPEFFEKKLNLDTIWLFPEKLKGMAIWRGVVEVNHDDAKEISDILVAYENRSDSPRDIEYYRQALQLRMDHPEDRLLNHFKTLDLIPMGAICAIDLMTDTAIETHQESPLQDNMSNKVDAIQADIEIRKQEVLKSLDEVKDKNEDMPEVSSKLQEMQNILSGKKTAETDPEMEKLLADMEKILPGMSVGKLDMKEFSFSKIDDLMLLINAHTAKKKNQIDEKVADAKAEAIEQLEKLKQIPDIDQEKIVSAKEAIKTLEQTTPEPMPLIRMNKNDLYQPLLENTDKIKLAIEQLRQQVTLSNPNNDLIIEKIKVMDEQVKDAEQQVEKLCASFRESHVFSAHFLEEGLSPHPKPVEIVAADFLKKVKSGHEVKNGDYACVDLSGQNLDGIDLSGALLEQVNLKDASLRGANLEKCVFARANLENADLSDSNLTQANLGAVQATGTDFSGADMTSTILFKGNFTKANFSQCRFRTAQMMYSNFQGANFSDAQLPDQIWVEVNLREAVFHRIKLIYNAFVKCDFTRADFSDGEAISCALVNSCFDQAVFAGANLAKSCFVGEETSFHKTRFMKGRFNQTNFLGMPLQGADFSESELVNALFNKADLTESTFSHAQARTAQFREAILTNANCDNIQLWEGSLSKAHLVGASFINANLAYTDFLRCTMGQTNFKNANLDCTLIQDWRPS